MSRASFLPGGLHPQGGRFQTYCGFCGRVTWQTCRSPSQQAVSEGFALFQGLFQGEATGLNQGAEMDLRAGLTEPIQPCSLQTTSCMLPGLGRALKCTCAGSATVWWPRSPASSFP